MLRTSNLLVVTAALALPLLTPSLARAEEEAAAAPVEKPKPAWRKELHMLEVGWLLGAFFPAKDHGLYGVEPPNPPRAFKTGFDIGLRFAYLPVRFVGVEIEGNVSPTKVDVDDGKRSVLYGFRGHVLLQLPTRITPFLVAGGGVLGGSSQDELIGKKSGGALHVGGGLKIYVSKWVAIRIDGRDIAAPSYAKAAGGEPTWAHHGEFTFGVSFVWGRKGTKMWPKG
jgi:OOP family OmpA-OmpF porin